MNGECEADCTVENDKDLCSCLLFPEGVIFSGAEPLSLAKTKLEHIPSEEGLGLSAAGVCLCVCEEAWTLLNTTLWEVSSTVSTARQQLIFADTLFACAAWA